MWVKLLTDLQMLGCELHKNAFGGRALPVPAGGAIALPQNPLAVIRGRGGNGKERVGNRDRGKGKWKDVKGYGGVT